MFSKCPSCGSSMEYNPEKRKLICPNCQSEADEIPKMDRVTANCPDCGAPLEEADNKVTYKCPYCHNWMVIEDNTEGNYEVKKILPFMHGKKKALSDMRAAFDNIPFMPLDFISTEREKDIKGVYVPFFIYDVNAKGENHYTGEINSSWSIGDTTYTKHDIYDISRPYSGVVSAPIDASDEISDDIVDAVSPFDKKDIVDYDPKYLPGFEMQVYDKPADTEEYKNRALEWVDKSVKDAMRTTVGSFSNLKLTSEEGGLDIGGQTYTYRPIYVYDYKYGSRDYHVYMNGSNDRVSGIAPVDKKRLTAHYLFEIICTVVAAVSLIEIFILL